MKLKKNCFALLILSILSITSGGGVQKSASELGFKGYTRVNAGSLCEHYDVEDLPWETDYEDHWKECGECDEWYLLGSHVDKNNDGKCDVCDCEFTAPTCNHNGLQWDYDDDRHWKECPVCENDNIEPGNHSDVNNDRYCDVCGYELYEEMAGDCDHEFAEWDYDDDQHWLDCPDCDQSINYGSHVDDNDDGKCDVCGRTSSSGHDTSIHDQLGWDSNIEEHYKYCDECGDILNGSHVDANDDGYCDVCNRHYKYTVTFNMNGHGTQVSSQLVQETNSPKKPNPHPTATGFTFGGWFKDSSCTEEWDFTCDEVMEDTTLHAKWTANDAFKPVSTTSIGGWVTDKGVKKQIVAFGFQVTSEVYNSLANDSDFGIVAYKNGASETSYSNGTIASLKTNEGRFYMYLLDESLDAATYYAKAFVKYDGAYIYSSLVNVTGALSGTEYTL